MEDISGTNLLVFPALAGINRFRYCASLGNCRVPRASGDKPSLFMVSALALAVFPALAGINRLQYNLICKCGSVPRASGDKPTFSYVLPSQ